MVPMTTTKILMRKLDKAATPPHDTALSATVRTVLQSLSSVIYAMCPAAFCQIPPNGWFLYVEPELPCAEIDRVIQWLTRCAAGQMTGDDAMQLTKLPPDDLEVLGVTPGEYARHMLAVFAALMPPPATY